MKNLPSTVEVANARLPQTYERAKEALAQCDSIDECIEWTDKWTALCTYARMSDDETLLKTAMRIKGRAVRRTGELLELFKSQGGKPFHTKSENLTDQPGLNSITAKEVAKEVGLSRHQRDTALAAAKIPAEEFEELIESDNPPTNKQLLKFNKAMEEPKPEGYAQATQLIGTVQRFAKWCKMNDPKLVSGGIRPHEFDELRECVSTIDGWLDKFIVTLGE